MRSRARTVVEGSLGVNIEHPLFEEPPPLWLSEPLAPQR